MSSEKELQEIAKPREGADSPPPPPHMQDLRRPGELSGWRLYTVLACMFLGLILSAMDSSVIATALVPIGHYFDDFITLQWLVLSYLLTYLGFALIFARLSDVTGRKWAAILAFFILGVFSLACGFAQTINQLIAFRALQGVGGSGLYAMGFTTVPEVTPPAKFAVLSALIGLTFAVSSVLGPVVGGVITTHSSWRWCFWFNVPCSALAIVVILFAWPKTNSLGRITWRQLDWVGCLLFLASSVLLVFALQEGGSGVYAWGSPTIVCTLVFSVVSAVACGVWLWWLSKPNRPFSPLFPLSLIKHRVLLLNFLITTLVGYVFYSVLIQLPQRLQIVNGKNSQSAGIALLPLSGASALASAFGGILSSKRNVTFWTLLVSSACMIIGSGLLYSVQPNTHLPAALYGYEAILGFGFGGIISSATVALKLNAPPEHNASAQGLQSQARILGGNIGLAIATIILNSHFASDLPGTLSPSQIAGLRQSLNDIETFTPPQQAAVAASFARAFRAQMLACVGLSAASLVVVLGSWQRNPPSFNDFIKASKEAVLRQQQQREREGTEDEDVVEKDVESKTSVIESLGDVPGEKV